MTVQEKREKLLRQGIIVINQKFDDELFEYAYFGIQEIAKNKNIATIRVYIQSNGGDCSALFSIYDALSSSGKFIETYITGRAYSAGAILALAGAKRFAYPHSLVLLHEVANDPGPLKASQAQHNADYLDYINKKLKEIIKDRTKMKAKEIEKYMDSNKDIFIGAEQALKYGIITEIITGQKVAK